VDFILEKGVNVCKYKSFTSNDVNILSSGLVYTNPSFMPPLCVLDRYPCSTFGNFSCLPLFNIGEEVEVEEEGVTSEGSLGDEAVGEVVLDETVGGESGSGEGSDEYLDNHHDEEEEGDGKLWGGYSRALFEDILGVVCITYAFYGVLGEVCHGRDG